MIWPKPGAVAIYGPVALSKTTRRSPLAQDFISYVTSQEGQTVIGRCRLLSDVGRGRRPAEARRRADRPSRLEALASQKAVLLKDYAKIFGGAEQVLTGRGLPGRPRSSYWLWRVRGRCAAAVPDRRTSWSRVAAGLRRF